MESQDMQSTPGALFETGKHYKVHKSYIWIGPLLAFGAVVLVVLLNGASGWVELFLAIMSGEVQVDVLLVVALAIVGILVLFGLIVGMYALAYRNMSYVFDEREFSFYSGIIVKKRMHLPYERVQSVNHRASLVQRIVGVCTVMIDSAGGSANKGVRVPYVRLQDAESMRFELFSRKSATASQQVRSGQAAVASAAPGMAGASGAPNVLDDALGVVGEWRGVYGGAGVVDEPVTFEYSLSNKELALASLSHTGPLAAGVCTALTLLVVAGSALMAEGPALAFATAFIIPAVIGVSLFVWLLSCGAVALGFGGFKVRRRGSRVEVERGLVTRSFSGIDLLRIQSIEVRQSTLRRLLGYSELSLGRIDAASKEDSNGNEASNKGLIIHPFLKKDQVDAVLDGLLPEFADRPRLDHGQGTALPRVALRRSLLRRCVWFNWVLWSCLVLLGCFAGMTALFLGDDPSLTALDASFLFDGAMRAAIVVAGVVVVASIACFAVSAVLWAHHSRYGWNRRFLVLHNDGLSTATSIIPRQKIQNGHMRDNPFQRRVNVTSIVVVTAAGASNGTSTRLLDVCREDGDAYLEWLR